MAASALRPTGQRVGFWLCLCLCVGIAAVAGWLVGGQAQVLGRAVEMSKAIQEEVRSSCATSDGAERTPPAFPDPVFMNDVRPQDDKAKCVPLSLSDPGQRQKHAHVPSFVPLPDDIVAKETDACDLAALRRANNVYHRNLLRRDARLASLEGYMGGLRPLSLSERVQILVEPTYPCPLERRVGESRDGGKWLCAAPLLPRAGRPAGTPPVVVSIGSNAQTGFEEEVFDLMHTRTFTFDPFMTDDLKQRVCLNPKLHYYDLGMSGNSGIEKMKSRGPIVNLTQLMDVIQASYIDVFKIDCEGCEFGVFLDLIRFPRDRQPIGQILVESHGIPSSAFRQLEAAGYRLFHAEPNMAFLEFYELSWIHESLVALEEWRPETALSTLVEQQKPLVPGRVPDHVPATCLGKLQAQANDILASHMSKAVALGTLLKDSWDVVKLFLLMPTVPCLFKERFGWWDTGGAWVCEDHLSSSRASFKENSASVLLCVGGPGSTCGDTQVAFDSQASAGLGASAHVLTLSASGSGQNHSVASAVQVHLKGSPSSNVAIQDLLGAVKAQVVDVLRLDCGGCEISLFEELKSQYGASSVPFRQLIVRFYEGVQPEKLKAMVKTWWELGYRIFYARKVGTERIGWEISLLHLDNLP